MGICSRIFQFEGSVFPLSICVAFPNALLTFALQIVVQMEFLPFGGEALFFDSSFWNSFTFLVGFLVVFRTQQAYARFWDGATAIHKMRAEWFDACSALISFCKFSDADEGETVAFKQMCVRLISMLHAAALAEIEDSDHENICAVEAFKYELIDAQNIDAVTMRAVKTSKAKVELIYQWVQQLIVENIRTNVVNIAPPLLSRVFQELANGMVEFHEAIKISTMPFPFPYAQTCDCLLVMHWIVTPFLSNMTSPWWMSIFNFLQVFILWSLRTIALELENPFGQDANDLDASEMQEELNLQLQTIVSAEAERTPLIPAVGRHTKSCMTNRSSFLQTWSDIDDGVPTRRRGRLPSIDMGASSDGSGSTNSRGFRRPSKLDEYLVDMNIIRRVGSITSDDSCPRVSEVESPPIRPPIPPKRIAHGCVGVESPRQQRVSLEVPTGLKSIARVSFPSCNSEGPLDLRPLDLPPGGRGEGGAWGRELGFGRGPAPGDGGPGGRGEGVELDSLRELDLDSNVSADCANVPSVQIGRGAAMPGMYAG